MKSSLKFILRRFRTKKEFDYLKLFLFIVVKLYFLLTYSAALSSE